MKYLKTFENKYADSKKLIEDYFLDISDNYNFRKIKSPGDQDFIYKMRMHIGVNDEGYLRSLSIVNLHASNLNGCFAILNHSSVTEEKYVLYLKYLRGKLKFPDFSDDIGIFRNRLIDVGYKVNIIRGSSAKKVSIIGKDEVIFEVHITK